MAENENNEQQGAFLADRFRNPAETMEKKSPAGDIWAGIVAILGFVIFAAVTVCLYFDMNQLSGM